MNIRHALEYAERFLNEESIESTEELISYVENIFASKGSEEFQDTPTFCCFWTKGDIIHCGRTPEESLFPGTWEERVKLCRECRDWCRAKIKELREEIKKKKEREEFRKQFFSKKSPPRGMYLPPKWAARI